jgi:small-conductance mechanosensitive channel
MTFSEIWDFITNIVTYKIFEINNNDVTPGKLLMLVGVMFAFDFVGRVAIRKVLDRVLSRTKFDTGFRYAVVRIAHYLILVVGAIVAVQIVGIDLSGLVVIFGFLSVGIGFGLQNLTNNFISGIILLFERPIQVGDRVTVGDVEGDVREINIRSTTVRSLNNISIIVPNSEFVSTTVINWTHEDPKMRLDVNVGVSYSSDLDVVLRSLREVALENGDVLRKPEPEVLFMKFGDSSWDMRLRAWIADAKRYQYIRSDINCAIVRKFRENNVEIPFPQRDLHVRSPLPVPLASSDSHKVDRQ